MRIKTAARTIKADKNPDHLTIDNGLTVETGGITATAGGITATAGGITATAGGLTATAGDITATAGDIVATVGDLIATAGDVTVTAGDVNTVAGDVNATGVVTVTEASADAGAGLTIGHNQVIHTTDSGTGTETLTGAIPANSFLLGVQAKIKATVSGAGMSTFLVGVTGDTNRFGDFQTLTQNTAQDPSDHQAETVGVARFYAAATDIILTADAGQFDAGTVTVDVYYITLAPVTNY